MLARIFGKIGSCSQGSTLGYFLSSLREEYGSQGNEKAGRKGAGFDRGFAADLISRKMGGRFSAWLKPSPDTKNRDWGWGRGAGT